MHLLPANAIPFVHMAEYIYGFELQVNTTARLPFQEQHRNIIYWQTEPK